MTDLYTDKHVYIVRECKKILTKDQWDLVIARAKRARDDDVERQFNESGEVTVRPVDPIDPDYEQYLADVMGC